MAVTSFQDLIWPTRTASGTVMRPRNAYADGPARKTSRMRSTGTHIPIVEHQPHEQHRGRHRPTAITGEQRRAGLRPPPELWPPMSTRRGSKPNTSVWPANHSSPA